jgi:hypothetical protein
MGRSKNPRRLVYSKVASLLYTDSSQKKLFDLPRHAIPISVTVFTAATSTSATCDIGTAADDDKHVAALDVSVAGTSLAVLLNMDVMPATSNPIYGLIGGSPSSGGPFTIIMKWIYLRTSRVI